MQTRSKSRKHSTFKSKDRTTCGLPSVNIFTIDEKENQYTEEELATIKDLVNQRRLNRKIYSKTLIDTYTPLTKLEKVKAIKDMDESSTNRFKTYSVIFDQIKKQMHDINNSLSENINDDKDNTHKTAMRKTMYLNNDEFIEEKEEDEFISPKYIIKTTPQFALDSYFDHNTFNENISTISLKSSPIQNSSILLVQSKRKLSKNVYSKDKLAFLRAKEEFKKSYGNGNLKELNDISNLKNCYCETSTDERIEAKYWCNQAKYYNCIIQ